MAPKIVPRRWALVPGTFGKARQIDWATATNDRQADLLRAAQMQHDWAWRLTVYRRAHKLTIPDLADRMDMSEQRMGDLLRGDSPANLLDLATAERLARTRDADAP